VINLLPQETETLIITHDWDVVLQRLENASTFNAPGRSNSPPVLAGWVKDDRFQLMLRQRRPNGFMPMVQGRIDPTSTGCLLFMDYRLMPMTRMYLVLWSIIVLTSGVLLSFYYDNILVGVAAVGIIACMNAVAWANFKIHRKPLREAILHVLE
jgi:hypothetical protein